jgi:hypothetical protein
MRALLIIAICATGFLCGYGARSLLSTLKKRRARRRASSRRVWQGAAKAAPTLADAAAEHPAEAEGDGPAHEKGALAPLEVAPHALMAGFEPETLLDGGDDLLARLRQTLEAGGAPIGQAASISIGDLWRVAPHVRASVGAEQREPWQRDPLLRSLYRPGETADGRLPRLAAEDRRKTAAIRVSRRIPDAPPRPVQQLLPFAEQKSRYPAE